MEYSLIYLHVERDVYFTWQSCLGCKNLKIICLNNEKKHFLQAGLNGLIMSVGLTEQSWALAVYSVKKVVFKTKAQVPSSESSLILGKDY